MRKINLIYPTIPAASAWEIPDCEPHASTLHLPTRQNEPRMKNFPRRQDWTALQWFAGAPVLALVLFGALMAAFLAYVHQSEKSQNEQALFRDIESLQQLLKVRLRDDLDQLTIHANELALPGGTGESGQGSLRDMLLSNPAIPYIAWADHERRLRMVLTNTGVQAPENRTVGDEIFDSPGFDAFLEAAQTRTATYSRPFTGTDNTIHIELHVPIVWQGRFEGTLIANYALLRTVQSLLPDKVARNYKLDLLDQGGNSLASTSSRRIHDSNLNYEVALDPPGGGIRLRGYAFEVETRLIDRSLLVAVAGLSLAIIASLLALSRYAAQRAAAEQERDRLFALSVDVLCVLDGDGIFQRVNPAFVHMFGQRSEHTALADLVHSEDKQQVVRVLTEVAAQPLSATRQLETRCQHQDGHFCWLSWSLRSELVGATRRNRLGLLLYAVAHDVTERRLAEQALASETRFRRAMEDSMLTGMRALDRQGKVTYVNRAFCQILGFGEEDLVGKFAPFPYWPADGHEEHQAHLEDVLAGRVPPSGLELEMQRSDGTRLQARMYVSPLVDALGEQSGWMTSMTDITEPRRIREALAAAQERLSAVLDQFDAAVAVVNLHGPAPVIELTNRTHRELFGDSHLPWSDVDVQAATVSAAAECFHATSHRWYEMRARAIRWVDGQTLTLLVATDITRRRANREIQRQQDEKLQQTARLVTMGEMASSLAHELNQPLTAIANYSMGSAARIQSHPGLLASDLLETMHKTAKQAERAGEVIRRIREFVKRSEPKREPCEPGEIVEDALALALLDAKRLMVTINSHIAPPLPRIWADKILLEQVLLNLVKNGIEAMQASGAKQLNVSVEYADGGTVFSVRDSGCGMSQVDEARLFEPFYTTKRDGMGMGLNICRSIIESHQGRLWVESNQPAAGCTFKFLLPVFIDQREAEIASQ
jgi:PAS domain S-box-containing protein